MTDELPEEALLLEVGLSTAQLGERIRGRDERFQAARLDVPDEGGELVAIAHRRPEHLQLLEVNRAQVDRHQRPGDRAGNHVAAAGA